MRSRGRAFPSVLIGAIVLLLFASMLSPTSSAQTPDADFDARCHGAPKDGSRPSADGIVLRCFGFDDNSAIQRPGGTGAWGYNFGAYSAPPTPDIDLTTQASGAGSLRFTTPAGSGAGGGGAWFTNFSNPATAFQLGEGQEIWVQYRWMPDANTLSAANNPASSNSGWGFKLGMIGTGDTAACGPPTGISVANCPSSCSDMETVIQPNFLSGSTPFFAYTTCGAPIGQPPIAKTDSATGNPNLHPNSTGTPVRHCVYPGPWNEPNCFNFVPNQWHTIKYHVKIGNWNQWNNQIQIWAARQGQPLQLLINCGPGAPCTAVPGGPVPAGTQVNGWFLYNSAVNTYKMGKIWLLPYVTNATGPVATQVTRYDELIISKQDIPDPGAPSSNVVPGAPCCLRLTQLTWSDLPQESDFSPPGFSQLYGHKANDESTGGDK